MYSVENLKRFPPSALVLSNIYFANYIFIFQKILTLKERYVAKNRLSIFFGLLN